MTAVDILGYAAGAVTAFTFLPPVVKTWKAKYAKDISLYMLLIAFADAILWLVWGLLINNMVVILTNAVMLVMSGIMIGLKLKYNQDRT